MPPRCACPGVYIGRAQDEQENTEGNQVTVSGSIQSDVLIPQFDSKIQTETDRIDEWAVTNTFADVNVMSEHVDAGARFEFLKHRCPVSSATTRVGACLIST